RGDILKVIPVPIFILLIGIGVWILIKRTAVYRYIYAVGGSEALITTRSTKTIKAGKDESFE
ncbi:unnamed protein product, partial [marine sediment metagenome]